MEADEKSILIVGNGDNSEALAEKLLSYENVKKVFITGKDNDIREDDITGLLKFVLENNICLTIPFSNLALNSDIVSFFQSNGQNIFGSDKKNCRNILSKIQNKKFLYKIHALTSKFGIFDNTKQANEYLKNASFPVVITTDDGKDSLICPTMSLACRFLTESMQYHGETEILIEEYIYGHNFTTYFITDGYSAIPFSTIGEYNFLNSEKNNKIIFEKSRYTPDFKISQLIISRLQNLIQNALKSLDDKQTPYMGILGINCTLVSEDKFFVNEFIPFLKDYDAKIALETFEDNILKIFESCINGFFSDEYNEIKTNDFYAVSTTVNLKNKNKKIILTQKAHTLNRAKELLKEDIEEQIFNI